MHKDRMEYHFKKASHYGMLAKYYEHMDPEKHIYYYKKHFYHESKFVKYHKMMKPHGSHESMMESSHHMNPHMNSHTNPHMYHDYMESSSS
jgi:hypothetical protein